MARNLLWLALLALAPVPFALTDLGWVPVVRLLAMGGLVGWIWLTEGGLVAGLIGGILLLQACVHAAWLRWLAGALLRRVAPERRAVAAAIVVALLFVAAQWPIYRTPLSTRSASADLWGIFQ